MSGGLVWRPRDERRRKRDVLRFLRPLDSGMIPSHDEAAHQ